MKKASSSIDDSSDVSSSDDNEDNGDDDSMGDGENDLQDEDDDSGVSSSEKEERSGISESDADVDAPTIVPAIIARINAPERDYHILEQDERARLLTTQGDLVVIISVINNSNKMLGYPPVWQKQVRSKRAYFHCGCSKDCFKVNLCTTKVASGGNKRKSSEIWKIHSIGERVCEPMEPFTTARLNTFIPKVVKANLVTLFDLGIGASAAHLQALHFAQMQNIRTSWEESDVKNFFDTLTRLYGEDIILVLEMLSEAGNFVKVDVKTQRNGKRHLNRFFAVDSTMKELFLLFGSFATLDSTFGKNWMQIPMQFFVGVTNENVIVPFATCATRSETKADYLWIMEAFYECYNTLPPVMNVDGDVSISDAIDATALAHHLEVDVGLCRHHHFGNVADRIVAIIPGTDLDQLKVDYNSALGSSSEEMFEERFKLFTGKYDGNNLLLRTYLVAHFYDLRTRLVLVWTGNRFCANFGSTGIGEAFHSLLASGTSSSNTLSDVLKKVDAITVKQIQANKKNASKWEIDLAALSENDLGGFVLASVCTLLSGSSFHVLMGRNVQSMFHSVHGVSVADDMGLQSWKVKDRRFSDGVEHLVTERLWGDESGSTYSLIKRNLSVDMDLGKGKCASCHETKHPVGVSGFNLPNRWEFLYPTNSSRKRVIVALGFGQPKEEGSSNNATSDGLLDTLQKYDYYLEENLEKGLGLRDAKVDTMEQMRKEEYGGQVLGKPRITADCWVQCGLLEGEETLPESERRTYCGKWYHLECFGLHRTPTKNERIPCLQCLQDRKWRVKPPKIDFVRNLALHNKTGLPRILENEVGGRIPTFNLTCDCASFIGAGLPCEGMLAVCRSTGSILSYKVFHSHWFSSSIRKPLPGHATFDTNERLKLDEDVIIGHQEREEPPSRLDNDIPPPKKAKVVQDAQKTRLVGLRDTRKGSSRGAKAVARITEAGEDVHNIDLGDVETGKGKSKSKRSRRFRKASGGKRNIKLATKPNQKNHSQQPNAVKMSKKRK